jgi:hypothetical protein
MNTNGDIILIMVKKFNHLMEEIEKINKKLDELKNDKSK